MNFKFDKWKLFTNRLYTPMVVAHPMWFTIARDMPMPLSISFAVEDKLESYDLNSEGT